MHMNRKLAESLPLRVLSADDIPTNRDLMRFLCRHLGYKTDLVNNGLEVLQQLETKEYDLIFLDIQMPLLDGLGVAREVCKRFPDAARRPKMVAVTASMDADGRDTCLAAGMNDYLPKPLLPQHLHDCVVRLFKGHSENLAGPTEGTGTPWVDWEHLQAITAGLDEADARACVSGFRESVETDYQAIRPRIATACQIRHSAITAAEIHGLKGCVQSLGWSRMSERCASLILELRSGRFTAWSELPFEIDHLYRGSSTALHLGLDVVLRKTAFASGTRPGV